MPDNLPIPVDLVLTDAHLITCTGPGEHCGLKRDAALAITDGRIAWIGPKQEVGKKVSANQTQSVQNRFVSPGLIDCHSHQVFGGTRADEWQKRLHGASYAEIAQQGGGIVSTVSATRRASIEELVANALPRVRSLMHEGVTTLEIKSGYGLNLDHEQKMLRAAKELDEQLPIDIVRTFLGAHSVPPEFAGRPDAYIDTICHDMIPALKTECDAVDVFCEHIAFDIPQTARVFEAARAHQLPIRIHAEQLSDMGGAALAAEFGALSADHLEFLDERGVKAMKESDTVAVLLPGAFYFIRETRKPPVSLLRDYQVPIAIATDYNPGSSPVNSLLTIMNMACTLFGLTIEEAICGVTRNAALALGLHDRGTLQVGQWADLAVWDVNSIAEIPYSIGTNPCVQVFKRGRTQNSTMRR